MYKKTISICIPVYNESENIDELYSRLTKVFHKLTNYNFEILFTDNYSTDDTFEKISDLHLHDPRVRGIRFSRNYGYQRSIMTNFMKCRGDAALQLDADMQDPPELIPEFIKKWEEGYKVVYGIRKTRKEGYWLNFLRKMFYRFIDYISEDRLPHDAGDFRLIDRCIIEELRKISDAQPYIRGAVASLGFKQIGINYDRDARTAGKSKFNLRKLMALAINGIIQQSTIPLRVASFSGMIIFVVTMLAAFCYFIIKIFFSHNWPSGFATVSILLFLSTGLNCLFLGTIGEYISAIYKNQKLGSLTVTEYEIDSMA